MSAENYESLQDHEERIKELEHKVAALMHEVDMIKFRERRARKEGK